MRSSLLVCVLLQKAFINAQDITVQDKCPNGKKKGEEWVEMKGDFGFRKHCTSDDKGGFCVKNLGCISVKGTFIKRGEKLTEYHDKNCKVISDCAIKGIETSYSRRYDCDSVRKTVAPITLPPAAEKTTESRSDVTGRPVQGVCPNGKRNGDEWDEMKGEYGFRKHCTTDENGGFCVKNLGCISVKGTFIKRGEKLTESHDKNCNVISDCVIKGTETSYSRRYDCDSVSQTLEPTPVTLPPAAEEATKSQPDVTGRPVQGLCPNGKRNGEEWDEMKGQYGFRKHCTTDEIGGFCVKNLGCISVKGTFIKRGEKLTEYHDANCNIISHCLIEGNVTSYRKETVCDADGQTLAPTPVTLLPEDEETTSEAPTLPPVNEKTTKDDTEAPITRTTKGENEKNTGKPGQCEGGKKENEEWDDKKSETSPKFRKRCIVHPNDGFCIIITGCYSGKGTFIERGKTLTETIGKCDYVSKCIAEGETETRYSSKIVCPPTLKTK